MSDAGNGTLSGSTRTATERNAGNAVAGNAVAGNSNSNGNASTQPPHSKRPRLNGSATGPATTPATGPATSATTATATSATIAPAATATSATPTGSAGAALPAAPPTASIGAGGAGAADGSATAGGAGGSATAGGAPSPPDSINDGGITFNRIGYSRLYKSVTDPNDIRVLLRTGVLHQTADLPKAIIFRNNMSGIKANTLQITPIRDYRDTCGVSLVAATKLLTSLMSSLFYESARHFGTIHHPPFVFQYNHLTNYQNYNYIHRHMYRRLVTLIGTTIPLEYILGMMPAANEENPYSNILMQIYGTNDATILQRYYMSILPDLSTAYINCPDRLYISIEDGNPTFITGHQNHKIYIRITNEEENMLSDKYYKRTLPSPPQPTPLPIFGATDLIGIHATIFSTLTAPFHGTRRPVIDGYHITDYYQNLAPGQEQEYFHDIGIPIHSAHRITLDQCDARINTLHNYLTYLQGTRRYINNLKQLSLYGIDYFQHMSDQESRRQRLTRLHGPQRPKMRYVMVPLQWYNHLFMHRTDDTTRYNFAFDPAPGNNQFGGSRKQLQNRRKNRITKVRSNRSRLNRRRTCRRRK